MTLDEIRGCDKVWLTPEDIADVIESQPGNIRLQAQDDPSKLGFPVTVVRSRVKINRKLFVMYFDGQLRM